MPRFKQVLSRKLKETVSDIFNIVGIEIRKKQPTDDRYLYRQLFSSDSIENRRFYTVSAGGHGGFGIDFEHPFWTNIDLDRPIRTHLRQFNPDLDISHDLLDMTPLPIETGSAEIILSQYTIEHIPENCARFFFRDAYRSLKNNGILKIVTPNTELDVLAYHAKDSSYFHWNDMKSQEGIYQMLGYATPLNQASFEQGFIAHFATNASSIHIGNNPNKVNDQEVREVMKNMSTKDALNYFTSKCCVEIQRKYRENHMSWWSPVKLKFELDKIGFKRVNILAPHQSNSRVLRNKVYFDRLWNEVATFVEAVK